jgi:hypothetical protein
MSVGTPFGVVQPASNVLKKVLKKVLKFEARLFDNIAQALEDAVALRLNTVAIPFNGVCRHESLCCLHHDEHPPRAAR